MVLTVNLALPVRSLPEFVEYARRAKPPLAYGSIGNGSQHHLVMEMLKSHAGIDMVSVPYEGGGPPDSFASPPAAECRPNWDEAGCYRC